MKTFILLNNGGASIIANTSNAMKFHTSVIYREKGLLHDCEPPEKVRTQYQSFNIAWEDNSGVVVAYREKKPTWKEIQKALNDAHESHPWRFSKI